MKTNARKVGIRTTDIFRGHELKLRQQIHAKMIAEKFETRKLLSRMMPDVRQLALLLFVAASLAFAQSSRPDPTNTPGATNPAVTPGTIATTICVPGWARTVRPPRRFTSYLKRRQLAGLGYSDQRMGDYERIACPVVAHRRKHRKGLEFRVFIGIVCCCNF